jgi:hypothetical protein
MGGVRRMLCAAKPKSAEANDKGKKEQAPLTACESSSSKSATRESDCNQQNMSQNVKGAELVWFGLTFRMMLLISLTILRSSSSSRSRSSSPPAARMRTREGVAVEAAAVAAAAEVGVGLGPVSPEVERCTEAAEAEG